MSRTINTMPLALQAMEKDKQIKRRYIHYSWKPEQGHVFVPAPEPVFMWYGLVDTHFGGANRGQSGWADIREGQRRCEVRDKLRRLCQEANGGEREDLELIVSHPRHCVLWDIW